MDEHESNGSSVAPSGKMSKDNPEEDRFKVFVGGLAWNTNDESLFRYFSKFGDIEAHEVVKDKFTGKSRGFGFVKYRDIDAISRVLEAQDREQFNLDGRNIQAKQAVGKDVLPPPKRRGDPPSERRHVENKIFVNLLPDEATNEDLRNAFLTYGNVVSAEVIMDKVTNRSRGFGFVTFDTESSMDSVLSTQTPIYVSGKSVEFKKAQPKESFSRKSGPSSSSSSSYYSSSSHSSRDDYGRPPPSSYSSRYDDRRDDYRSRDPYRDYRRERSPPPAPRGYSPRRSRSPYRDDRRYERRPSSRSRSPRRSPPRGYDDRRDERRVYDDRRYESAPYYSSADPYDSRSRRY